MTNDLKLLQHIERFAQDDPIRRAVADAIAAFAAASIEISELIGRGALAGILGQSMGGQNADGDAQKDLDIHADDIIRRALKAVPYTALASEEAELPEIGDASALIEIAYDPLDGSSNIDTNMTVGTIFSIRPGHRARIPFMGPGNEQLAAGFVVYGPQTSLVLTLADGVDIFTLDARSMRLMRRTSVIGSNRSVNLSRNALPAPPVPEVRTLICAGPPPWSPRHIGF